MEDRRKPNGPSRRAQEITPFLVMDILERAQELERRGEHIIHLEIGEPDFATPQVVKDAAFGAMAGRDPVHPFPGVAGAAGAFVRTLSGEVWGQAHPGPVHRHFRHLPGHAPDLCRAVGPGGRSAVHRPPLRLLSQHAAAGGGRTPLRAGPGGRRVPIPPGRVGNNPGPRTKAMLINSPSNPTGTLLSQEDLAALAELGPFIVSDEIYHGLVYEGKEHSILEFTDRAFVINGFSKLYAMTGWRLGYLIAPPDFMRPLQKLMQNFFISANAFVQRAGIAALTQAGPE